MTLPNSTEAHAEEPLPLQILRSEATESEDQTTRIRAQAVLAIIDRQRMALETISNRGCGVPGHAVAVGCGASTIAWKALNAPDEVMCQNCEGRGYTLDWGPWDLTTGQRVERGVMHGVRVPCEDCRAEGWVSREIEKDCSAAEDR